MLKKTVPKQVKVYHINKSEKETTKGCGFNLKNLHIHVFKLNSVRFKECCGEDMQHLRCNYKT